MAQEQWAEEDHHPSNNETIELGREEWDYVIGALRVATRLSVSREDQADAIIWPIIRAKIEGQRQ